MPKASVVFFASHAHGGVRELWTSLAEGFLKAGHRASLVGLYPFEGSEEEPAQGRAQGLAWTYILPTRPRGFVGKIALLWHLMRWLLRDRPDVILSAMPAANVLIVPLARIFSPRTALILSHHSPVTFYRPLLNRLDRFTGCATNVKAIVSVSSAVEATLADKPEAYRAKCLVIHNALPPRIEKLLEELRQAADQRQPGRTIAVCGRLEAVKNHAMLIRALPLMRDVRVTMIGDGPDRRMLGELMTSLGVADRVSLLGNRPREEALRLLSSGDLFVQVSLLEGHSLALIEAAKLGLPLIVSNVPGQVEGITARDGTLCGLLVDLGDEEGLARAVHRVLDDPGERRRLSDLALRLASEAMFDTLIFRYIRLVHSAADQSALSPIPQRQAEHLSHDHH